MKKVTALVKDTFSHFSSHGGTSMGAALSYYAIFSIAPLLVLLISMVSIFFGKELTESSVMNELTRTLGTDLATFIQGMVVQDESQSVTVFSAMVSALILAAGAYGVFSQLNSSLDDLWKLPTRTKIQKSTIFETIRAFIKEKLAAFSLIPLIGLILLCSIIITTLIQFFSDQATTILPGSAALFKLLDIVASIAIPTTLFALIYKVLPNVKLPWREVFLGGFITSILFFIGKLLIGLYLSNIASVSAYGAASSLVALLIWIYYSSQVFYIGASFIFVYSKKQGYLKNNS